MKHLRIYEEFRISELEKGDYVIMRRPFIPGMFEDDKYAFTKFLDNNIGIITNTNSVHNNITVKYHNVPMHIQHILTDDQHLFNTKGVKYLGKTIDDIKMQISAKEFNI